MNREFGSLPAPAIASDLSPGSILCLPVGSFEQHGPHLPVSTDAIIAEEFSQRLVAKYRDKYDLWLLPTIPYGLSFEHRWASGTVTLTSYLFLELLDAIVGEYVRTCAARTLLIVNGHGGNRGILEAAVYELEHKHALHICVIHPSSMSTVSAKSALPEIHAGYRETSLMLALAPDLVHIDRLPDSFGDDLSLANPISQFVLHRGTTWPWSSGDPRISSLGIMGGNPRMACQEIGEANLNTALDATGAVLQTLSDDSQRPPH
jgi:creatinine amidohydrolase/Fe(II)-dependent formamide hydrolase-like protein